MTTALCFPTGTDSFTGRDLGGTVYRSGMCLLCYQEYLEVGGGQVQGHNPPAFTRGLIKTAKAAEVRADCLMFIILKIYDSVHHAYLMVHSLINRAKAAEVRAACLMFSLFRKCMTQSTMHT